MAPGQLPAAVSSWIASLALVLEARVAWRLRPMLVGLLFARGRPIVLGDGDYLLPVYHETGEDRERTATDTCSFFFRYNGKTKTWTESNRIVSPNGNLQPAPARISDDYLVAYCRPGGDFEPNPKRFVIRSESRDGGRTWSKGQDSQFR